MNIHHMIDFSQVNGPGNRAVIWFQGCSLGCKGCWNPETHSFSSTFDLSMFDLSLSQVMEWVCSLKNVEGITFSGGEPLQQADLEALCLSINVMRPDLSLGMFTGYTPMELMAGAYKIYLPETKNFTLGSQEKWNNIKKCLDFAVMGRYNQNMKVIDKSMCGSANQSIQLFSDRYTMADFQPQATEIVISNGRVLITGFPSKELENL